MNPLTALRNAVEITAAAVVSTFALAYITVTSGPAASFRLGPGA